MNTWQNVIQTLFPFESPYLLACSGGMDSVFLFHLLLEVSPPHLLQVCHFDHRMREESSQDAEFVANLCQQYQIPCFQEKAEQIAHSEEEARRYRRAFFRKTAQTLGLKSIFLAHHQDDQIETILLRILRGTGLYALRGMSPKSPLGNGIFLLRPLLSFSRDQIQQECIRKNLIYREDTSNQDPRYLRNRVRHELVPLLRNLSASVDQSFLRLIQQAQTLPDIPILSDLYFRTLNALPSLLKAVSLKKYLEDKIEHMLDFTHVERILQSLSHGQCGETLFLPGAYSLKREKDRFVLQHPKWVPIPFSECVLGRISQGFWGSYWYGVYWGESEQMKGILDKKVRAEWQIQLDPDTISFPLRFRNRCAGDRIQSAGFDGKHHHVKKLLIDAKIPQKERAYVPLLVDAQENILWIPHLRKSIRLSGKGFVIGLQFFANHFFLNSQANIE